jgi:hypothetical protein
MGYPCGWKMGRYNEARCHIAVHRMQSVSSSSGRQEIDTCNTIQCELSGNRRYATLSSRNIVGGMHYNDAVKSTPATS